MLLTTSRWSSTLALALALTANAAADVRAQSSRVTTPLSTIELRQGLVITKSGRVTPRTYRLPAPASLDSSVVTIRGNDITVDFAGATMEGAPSDVNPDDVSGIAVRVDSGRNVRILNAHIRGYKVGIIARGTRGLSLIDNDLSYNWKPRLYSVIEHESLIDWLSFHHNEKDEWLRYGSGAYLSDVKAGEISGNTVTQGMNGLVLIRTNGLRIWNNNFSFNSGLGIGLYRSSGNSIMHNRGDYDLRGQDAADLLIYEQSDKNIVAYNSMTHGGDGVFLWAGQSTMDTGEGGANDNLFYGNDFSFAPANGIEATFSRNTFIGNYVEGCEYGMWGGYSFDSRIVGNRFLDNRTGIAIEHGQNNRFVETDSIAVLSDTSGYSSLDNTIERDAPWPPRFLRPPKELVGTVPEPIKNAFLPSRSDTSMAGRPRSAIIVDEWGPYDYRSPKLWPVDSSHGLPLRLGTLGPAGKWRVASRRGVASLSADNGAIGDTISVTPKPDSLGDWELALDYTGESTVSPRGERRSAGVPYRFSYGRFEPKIDWSTSFFKWTDSTTDPRTNPDAMTALTQTVPILAGQVSRLDFEGYRALANLPRENFALEATGSVDLAPGEYTLRALSDDGIRVWVDGALVIDDWKSHETALDFAALTGGHHDLRVQYYQGDGWYELRLDIVRGHDRSPGSPGAHGSE